MHGKDLARSEQTQSKKFSYPSLPEVANAQGVSRFLADSTATADIHGTPSIGDVISTHQAGRIGTVTRVYGDKSVSVRWHDKPSVADDLGHERIPRRSFSIFETSDIRSICIKAIRDAALARTDHELLDVAGDALMRIARLQAADSSAEREIAFCGVSRSEVRHG
ncbi:hypothetical protein WM40_17290 [Robbsia andropogonis]|uniref:Uncharacterized protein n=1 Tax=Robbsia andropogonis TaxID=28092 RepID=A0A0F5JX06_9BURK|nr:hypothetical protein [Robbsia andropogonis]KKB62396.1 hypothetical protein WM40_17290 [Robbsia andropogonis]